MYCSPARMRCAFILLLRCIWQRRSGGATLAPPGPVTSPPWRAAQRVPRGVGSAACVARHALAWVCGHLGMRGLLVGVVMLRVQFLVGQELSHRLDSPPLTRVRRLGAQLVVVRDIAPSSICTLLLRSAPRIHFQLLELGCGVGFGEALCLGGFVGRVLNEPPF